jgi:hypothetical protein
MKNPTAKKLFAGACTAGLLAMGIGSAPLYAANPCNPCAAKPTAQQGNPCAAKPAANPCAAKNPCAPKNPCAAR